MPKHLEVHKLSGTSGEVAIVRLLDKKLIDPPIIQEIADELSALVDEGHVRLVISFVNVESLISPALNALIRLSQKIAGKSGSLRLCSLSQVIRDVYGATRLDTYFTIRPSEKEALADF